MIIMSVLAMVEGIVAIIFAGTAIGNNHDEAEDAELQATNTIVDTVQGFDRLLWTDMEVIEAPQKCKEGWKPMFGREWPGIRKGCFLDGELMALDEF